MMQLSSKCYQRQFSPTITAFDIHDCLIAIAIEYSDCNVIELKHNSSNFDVLFDSQESNGDSISPQNILELQAHKYSVTCISLHKNVLNCENDKTYMVSASSDRAILWEIDYAPFRYKQNVLASLHSPDDPSCIALYGNELVAIASASIVHVYSFSSLEAYASLTGHGSNITDCAFHPLHKKLLVTCSEDRTFKVWDLENCSLLYQSAVLSAFAIISIAINSDNGDLALGCTDGTLKLFSFDGTFAKERGVSNIALHIQRYTSAQRKELSPETPKIRVISSLPNHAHKDDIYDDSNQNEYGKEISSPILSLHYSIVSALPPSDGKILFSGIQEEALIPQQHYLFVATFGFLLIVNAFSLHVSVLVDFDRHRFLQGKRISTAKQFSWSHSNALYCGVIDAFSPLLTLFAVHEVSSESVPENTPSFESIIPRQAPPEKSVLNRPLFSLSQERQKIVDKKISRVSSTGYGSMVPYSVALKLKGKQKMVKPPVRNRFVKEYPMQCPLIRNFQHRHALNEPIIAVAYSPNSEYLATAGSDGVCQVLKLPLSRYKSPGTLLMSHEPTKSLYWSHNHSLLLTSSENTASVWRVSGKAPVLQIKRTSLVQAQFFYMDKFIVVPSDAHLRLYQYALEDERAVTREGDVTRSRKRKVAEFLIPEIQQIRAIACVNSSFLSYAVAVAGSDHSIRIFDVASEKQRQVIAGAHVRGLHTLVFPQSSSYTSHPSNFYDLLLSCGIDSSIQCWDLRENRSVMRFQEHVNRVYSVGATFSPCMRYVSSGSEDRRAIVYDLRTGRALHRFAGHDHVVMDIAYNPLYPQLVTASYDGTIRFYTDR